VGKDVGNVGALVFGNVGLFVGARVGIVGERVRNVGV
jgi:hypothetical protein